MEKITLTIKGLWFGVKNWIKENPKETAILALILLLGAFLRLYKISEYMTFLGDEGRDVIIVRRLLAYGDFFLIGPGTSIGEMYLGPLYYYMMAPALFLAGFSPVGPAIQIALLGVVTIALVYFIGKEWFGKWGAALGAFLYAISPTLIIYSRSSWNPNIMPFFALACIYSLWRIWRARQWKWVIVLGISFAFVLQSHYLGLLLAPTIGLFWLLTFLKEKRKGFGTKEFIKTSVIAAVVFAALMSPLVIFDARHGFRNFSAMKKFFAERQTTVSARPWNALPKIPELSTKITSGLVTGRNNALAKTTAGFFLGAIGWLLIFRWKGLSQKEKAAYILLGSWLGFAILGLGLYKQEIYDHYYGFFFAAPFLLLAGLSQEIVKTKNKGAVILLAIGFLFLSWANIKNNPLWYSPNRQLQRGMIVAEKIREESKGERFNLAVIAERNYEDGYQYFLEKEGAPVVDIDAQRPETITDQLFVVCEIPREKCDPTHNPKTEVANFGWTKIEKEWEISGVLLYKLVHSK